MGGHESTVHFLPEHGVHAPEPEHGARAPEPEHDARAPEPIPEQVAQPHSQTKNLRQRVLTLEALLILDT